MTESPEPKPAGPLPSLAVCAVVLVAAFVALSLWSWGKWGDPVIDWGQQLYVPWQVSEGSVLYRDIAWYLGPLPVHVNALAFRLFGPSVRVLALLNLGVLAGLTALVFAFFAKTAGRGAGLFAALLALTLFGFAHNAEVGNYNFVSPYTHAATHGMLLAVMALTAFAARVTRGGPWLSGVAGLCLGAVFLTKPEIFLAAAGALAVGLVAARVITPAGGRVQIRDAAYLLGASGVAPLLMFGVLAALRGDVSAALGDVAGAWRAIFASGDLVARAPLYVAGAGLDEPLKNSGLLGLGALLVAVGVWLALAVDAEGRRSYRALVAPGLVFVAAALHVIQPTLFPRSLPALTLGLLFGLGAALRRHRGDEVHTDTQRAGRLIALFVWAAFALALLLKMGLYARLHHYGFVLALPATLLVAVAITWLIPDAAAAKGDAERGVTLRKVGLYVFVFAAAFSLKSSNAHYARRVVTLGEGADAMLVVGVDSEGRSVGSHLASTLKVLQTETRPDETVAVLPEGILLNYLARRRAPTRHTKHVLHELAGFGEPGGVELLKGEAPDVVVLVHRSLAEWGAGPVGTNPKDRELLRWVRATYRVTHTFGAEPFQPDDQFGVQILRKR